MKNTDYNKQYSRTTGESGTVVIMILLLTLAVYLVSLI